MWVINDKCKKYPGQCRIVALLVVVDRQKKAAIQQMS